ncbi:MAG: hypothetical protein AB9835_10485 [Eubacteriales bacterium]
MKKALILAITAALVLILATTAFAANGNSGSSGNGARGEQVQQRVDECKADNEQRREDREQFRAAAQEKRDAVKATRDVNKALCTENAQLREQLTDALLALQENGKVLDPTTVEKLNTYNASLKELTSKLGETKGGIKEQLGLNKGFARDMDYESMNKAFEEIVAVQNERNTTLTEINTILKQMLELAK